MTHSRIYLTIFIALLFSVACAMPALPAGRESFNTSVAKTLAAGLTQNYVSPTFTLTPTLTFTPTLTPIPPTITNTPLVTLTPTFPFTPTSTETPLIPPPDLSVSVNTNCRSGPGKDFEIEGSLLKDESVKVYGIDPSGLYWYIENPDPGADYCWLLGRYAIVDGSISLVPVITPPAPPTPTPTGTPAPDFRLTYSNLDGCGTWWAEITVYNSGQATFQSVRLSQKDNFSGEEPTSASNGFVNFDNCDVKTVTETLAPGYSTIISAPPINSNPKDRKITLTVTLCTGLGYSGECISRVMTFKP